MARVGAGAAVDKDGRQVVGEVALIRVVHERFHVEDLGKVDGRADLLFVARLPAAR